MMPRTRLGEVLFGLLFLAIALAILAGVLWTSFTYLYPPRPAPKSQFIHSSVQIAQPNGPQGLSMASLARPVSPSP
jgi:hypothetical protein